MKKQAMSASSGPAGIPALFLLLPRVTVMTSTRLYRSSESVEKKQTCVPQVFLAAGTARWEPMHPGRGTGSSHSPSPPLTSGFDETFWGCFLCKPFSGTDSQGHSGMRQVPPTGRCQRKAHGQHCLRRSCLLQQDPQAKVFPQKPPPTLGCSPGGGVPQAPACGEG